MPPSPTNFNERARGLLLDLIWRQWSELGVAAHAAKGTTWTVDLEALVLITTVHGRSDPRLFDEMLDWLWGNAQWVNVQRLRNIQRRLALGDARVLGAIADWVSQRTTLSKWKTMMTAWSETLATERLFRLRSQEQPWNGPVDPIFARHGLQRDPVERREMSRVPSPRSAAMLTWKLRSLFGVQARCELLLWLLTHERGHPAEITRATYYSSRTVEDTLRELTVSGLVRSAPTGRAVSYWAQPEDWLMLRSWEQPRGFPRWVDWPRFFLIQDRLLAVGAKHDMSPLLHASELRRVFEDLFPVVETAQLLTEFKASRNDTGREFTLRLMEDIEGFYAGI